MHRTGPRLCPSCVLLQHYCCNITSKTMCRQVGTRDVMPDRVASPAWTWRRTSHECPQPCIPQETHTDVDVLQR